MSRIPTRPRWQGSVHAEFQHQLSTRLCALPSATQSILPFEKSCTRMLNVLKGNEKRWRGVVSARTHARMLFDMTPTGMACYDLLVQRRPCDCHDYHVLICAPRLAVVSYYAVPSLSANVGPLLHLWWSSSSIAAIAKQAHRVSAPRQGCAKHVHVVQVISCCCTQK